MASGIATLGGDIDDDQHVTSVALEIHLIAIDVHCAEIVDRRRFIARRRLLALR